MILQALVDYYDRKSEDPDTALAPAGFEQKEIPFLIIIDDQGKFVQFEDTRSGDGKKKRARTFLVPQGAKKTSGISANLLWDNAEYVFGVDTKGKPGRVVKQHLAYKARLDELPPKDAGVMAVRAFLAAVPIQQLMVSPLWEEIIANSPVVTFRMISDRSLVCQRPAIVSALQAIEPKTYIPTGICLVTGEHTQIQRLHSSIQGVWGAQSSGANIFSFNQRSFESYGKEQRQGENAPVGRQAAFAYTTALNHLLGKDSTQRIQVGDASTIFWADKDCDLEKNFPSLWREPSKDNPDACVAAVKSVYGSVSQGQQPATSEERQFFVLGLAPNAARISIRFWMKTTATELATKLAQHFRDLEINHAPHERPHLPLFRLLVSISAQGKSDNVPANLAGETMRTILEGGPYPITLLQAAIRRIRADQSVPYARAALIKACINRRTRLQNPNDPAAQEELKVSLDPTNRNAGYRLGRLFAMLERVQERASGGSLNATIHDRFYGAASSTPGTVFPNLMKLSKHHLAKLNNRGEAVNMEMAIGEIVDGLDDFPRILRIEDQGRFAIGYYHQRQAFYKKPEPGEQA